MSSGDLLDFNLEARRNLMEAAGRNRADTDVVLKSLAAEIAMGIHDFNTILANHGLTEDQWSRINRNARFLQFLAEASVEWGATGNAQARIKAKMESMLETALPTLYALLIKGDELSPSKVKLVEAIMKGGGVGVSSDNRSVDGVSITINLDAQTPIKPTITIDHDAEDM